MSFREAVRRRPAMYVGDVDDGSGLHAVLGFVVAETLARTPTRVAVTLHADGSATVADDGGPFPGDIASVLTLVTAASDRLPIVCSMSSRLAVRLRRDGAETVMRTVDGRPAGPATRTAVSDPEAPPLTEITFLAAAEVFGEVAYDRALVARQLRDLGRREPRATLTLIEPPPTGREER